MYTLEQTTEARNLVGTEINEMEYIDHLIVEKNTMSFVVIHLNGNERLIEINKELK